MIIINGYICIIFRSFLLYHFSYISRTCLSRSALHFIAFLLLHTIFPDYHTKICAYMLLLFANFLISKWLFYVSVEHQHIDIDNVRGNNPYIKYRTIHNNKHLSTNNKQIVKRDYNHLREYSSIYHMWLLKNSINLLGNFNFHSLSKLPSIQTFDLSTSCTTIPNAKVKTRLAEIMHNAFNS